MRDMDPSEGEVPASRLLLKALESLEPQERSLVLEGLLGRALSMSGSQGFGPFPVPLEPRSWQAAFATPTGGAPSAGDQRMFPVRLPERDHARLKAWCEGHAFPMAVVVRGLIERFLDQQEPGV
jgi:hypothetical protein